MSTTGFISKEVSAPGAIRHTKRADRVANKLAVHANKSTGQSLRPNTYPVIPRLPGVEKETIKQLCLLTKNIDAGICIGIGAPALSDMQAHPSSAVAVALQHSSDLFRILAFYMRTGTACPPITDRHMPFHGVDINSRPLLDLTPDSTLRNRPTEEEIKRAKAVLQLAAECDKKAAEPVQRQRTPRQLEGAIKVAIKAIQEIHDRADDFKITDKLASLPPVPTRECGLEMGLDELHEITEKYIDAIPEDMKYLLVEVFLF